METLLRWLLPLLTAALCAGFAGLLVRQWLARRRPYQLVWAVGLTWYGIASATGFVGQAVGWSPPVYRAWYLFGALLVAAYLGAGELYLLRGTRFGYLVAAGVLVGTLPALARGLSALRGGDPEGLAWSAFGVVLSGVLAAALVALAQWRRPDLVGHVGLACLLAGSLYGAAAVAGAPVDLSQSVDPATGIPQGRGFPESVRLLTPLFNIAGGMALVLGAAFTGWQFWRRHQMPQRAASCALVALGGFIPSLTSSLNRFGLTSVFHLGELLGVLCIFAGFLVSTEVFARRSAAAEAPGSASPARGHAPA